MTAPAPLISRRRRRVTSRGKLVINRLSMHEEVAQHLREMIVTGKLESGVKIPVAELSDQLGVSLTPLREALKVLAEEQLVQLMPNRGARVSPVTLEDTRALFEVISGIEALAAELACARMSDKQLAVLDALHTQLSACHTDGDTKGYFKHNRDIHNRILEFASNPILFDLRAKLAVRAEQVRYMSIADRARRGQAFQDHEDLMAALRARDCRSAGDIWRRHLIRSGREACLVLEQATPAPA